jgi:putative membrane protein
MMYGYPIAWPAMTLWMLFQGVLWLLVVGVAVWLLLRLLERRPTVTPPAQPFGSSVGPSALEILRQRYARGDIDAEAFERMRTHLEPSPTAPTSQLAPPMEPVATREPTSTV